MSETETGSDAGGERVDRLPAGPELDARVHREVMGEDQDASAVPPYSTDLQAARTLERVFEYLDFDGVSGDYTAFASLAAGGGRLIFAEGEGETPELALCRAALLAARRLAGRAARE